MKIITSKVNSTLIALLFFIPILSGANEIISDCVNEISTEDKNQKLWVVNLTAIGVVTAWGVNNWDYFRK